LIGVAVGTKDRLLAGMVTELAARGTALALPTVAPTARPAPATVAAAMAAQRKSRLFGSRLILAGLPPISPSWVC
jgi:hypothetical protein